MEIKDYLLACISEECGEIVQAVGKAHRFGLLDVNPNTDLTNWSDLRSEVHDLIAVYEMLCDNFDKPKLIDKELTDAKKSKVMEYMEYSIKSGRL